MKARAEPGNHEGLFGPIGRRVDAGQFARASNVPFLGQGRTVTGLIVAGVDGSPSSVEALRWAAKQAQLTGDALEVVTAWQRPASFGAVPWPEGFDPERDARDELRTVVESELGTESGVEVHQRVVEGPSAPALIQASERADLLVVGSRGHGAFAGMLLGSVSQHCVSHARCPVVVVPCQASADGG